MHSVSWSKKPSNVFPRNLVCDYIGTRNALWMCIFRSRSLNASIADVQTRLPLIKRLTLFSASSTRTQSTVGRICVSFIDETHMETSAEYVCISLTKRIWRRLRNGFYRFRRIATYITLIVLNWNGRTNVTYVCLNIGIVVVYVGACFPYGSQRYWEIELSNHFRLTKSATTLMIFYRFALFVRRCEGNLVDNLFNVLCS